MLQTKWLGRKCKIHMLLEDLDTLFVSMSICCSAWYFGKLAQLSTYLVDYKCYLGASLIHEKERFNCTHAHSDHFLRIR